MASRHFLFFLLPILCWTGCRDPAPVEAALPLVTGPWRMELDLDSTTGHVPLPFTFDLGHEGGAWSITIHNQLERIQVDSIVLEGDSIRIRMPFFDSEFRGVIAGDSAFNGLWTNHYKGLGYAIPFMARAGGQPRFLGQDSRPPAAISGDWEVHFNGPDGEEPAIGIFRTEGQQVTGSFATETGDLRFLEGRVSSDSLWLSTFNGFQAYLFRAAIRGDSLIGEFRSGHRYRQPWHGVRNPDFKLADDETATQLDPAHPFAFAFPGLDGRVHRHTDPEFAGKVLVVEVMGTWCPNCLDEARMLQEFQALYGQDGLRVVGLGFERFPDRERSLAALKRFRDGVGISYQLLYAGAARGDTVEAKLPFIEEFKSYPTTFLVARDGTVRHIYTGIYGPSTGDRYLRFRERMQNAILDLLREAPPKAQS
jgi:thiol-disulfide isomerase/thioredoxin